MLKGYKTYIVAALAILGAIAAYLTGDSSLSDAIQLVVEAVLAATVRAGVAHTANKVQDHVTAATQEVAYVAEQATTAANAARTAVSNAVAAGGVLNDDGFKRS